MLCLGSSKLNHARQEICLYFQINDISTMDNGTPWYWSNDNILYFRLIPLIYDYGCCLHLGLLTSPNFYSRWPALTALPPNLLSAMHFDQAPSGSSWTRQQESCSGCARPSFWTKHMWSSSFNWGVLWDLIMMLEQFWRIREGVVWDLNCRCQGGRKFLYLLGKKGLWRLASSLEML